MCDGCGDGWWCVMCLVVCGDDGVLCNRVEGVVCVMCIAGGTCGVGVCGMGVCGMMCIDVYCRVGVGCVIREREVLMYVCGSDGVWMCDTDGM